MTSNSNSNSNSTWRGRVRLGLIALVVVAGGCGGTGSSSGSSSGSASDRASSSPAPAATPADSSAVGTTAAPADSGPQSPPFDADSAFALLKRQVEFGPRVPGTDAHQRQLEWMTAYLAARADSVFTQPFEYTTRAGKRITMTNVVARFNLGERDRLLFAAHWDTRPIADQDPDPARRKEPIPGANDGASGVAVLMELADVLSHHVPPIGVDLVFFDGEDYGPDEMYLGAEHFAANLPVGYQPLYGILLDMVGDQHPVFPPEAFSRQEAPEVVARIWNVAEQMGYSAYFPRQEGMAIQDDHLPLNRAGIRTADIIDFDYGPDNRYWHTHLDDLHHVAPVGLGVVGNVLLKLVFMGG